MQYARVRLTFLKDISKCLNIKEITQSGPDVLEIRDKSLLSHPNLKLSHANCPIIIIIISSPVYLSVYLIT